MLENLDSLVAELQLLASSADEDFTKQFWANYENYLHQYNILLSTFQALGFCQEKKPIELVPDEHKAFSGGFSKAEQAKLREIVNAAKSLLHHIVPHLKVTHGIETAILRVEQVCSRFHLAVRQLRDRYADRQTLEVEDEYDVQDLLHVFLVLDFDDIRVEEWTPSYAGGSAKMDFLLKREQIVIEVKKTRKGLTAKEVGEQLIVDIEKYKEHPDCKTLVCFVYDPEGRIANPRGVEADLESRGTDDLIVKAFVRPTGK